MDININIITTDSPPQSEPQSEPHSEPQSEPQSQHVHNVHNPFINKYKPTFLSNFQQLDTTTISLIKSLIHLNNLNILIVGDSGTGKTSIINSIIREYYGSEYNNENILVLNSLKEQGIQYYRNDLKVFCQTCSLIKNKKKIILLDDIDLINEQSQQVFRNCMDKYKHNVNFISSCTNIQKIIDSLQSRTIIVKINPVTSRCLKQIMNKITLNENLFFYPDAEQFLLNISNNSIRILVNYLEKIKIITLYNKLCSNTYCVHNDIDYSNICNELNLQIINKLSTNISYTLFDEYTNLVISRKIIDAVKIFYNLHDEGYSVMDILDNYFIYIKITNLLCEDIKYKLTTLVCKYIIHFHNIHEDELELALFTNSFIKLL